MKDEDLKEYIIGLQAQVTTLLGILVANGLTTEEAFSKTSLSVAEKMMKEARDKL